MPDYIFQLTAGASFTGDLGLDSLDAVEVVMAVEEVRS
jgi:acyl carrier protein